MSLDLSVPLREAVLGNPEATGGLAEYLGGPAVFTRRPVPSEAGYPMTVISPNIALTDEDGLTSSRPVVIRDITTYGQLGQAGDDSYRGVEDISYVHRQMFHRRKDAIIVPGYHVVDIVATGPIPAPTDDEKLIGRAVILTIRLRQQGG